MSTFEEARQAYYSSWSGEPSSTRLQGWETGWHARDEELAAKDQIITDLQGIDKVADHANEVIGLMQKDIDTLTVELAASREKMECGHPKMFWVEDSSELEYIDGIPVARVGGWPTHCTLCAEIQAERAAVLAEAEWWALRIEKRPLSGGLMDIEGRRLAELRAASEAPEADNVREITRRIMLERMPGAALNAVIEDYPEMWAEINKAAPEAICPRCAAGVAVEVRKGKRVHRYRQQIDKQHDTWKTIFEECHGTGKRGDHEG
jgi:hypothetical protein